MGVDWNSEVVKKNEEEHGLESRYPSPQDSEAYEEIEKNSQ